MKESEPTGKRTRSSKPLPLPSIKKNYFFNLLYQIMTLLTPFITTPYISRILGPDGTGIYSYTNSVVQYFAILAALGTASYGQREIARNRNNKERLSRLFWEIQLLCAFTTALCLIAWLFIIGFGTRYRACYAVLTMTLTAVAFDVSWFFGGLEFYSLIVVRNMLVKLAGIIGMFLLIKSKNDLLLYISLIAATGLLGNLSLWGYLGRFLVKPDFKSLRPLRHLRETFVYFIPTIAVSVYTILDKTMLGFFTGEDKSQNGFYEYATGFVNMAKILIISFNSVMSARMSYLFGENDTVQIRHKLMDALNFVLLLAFPLMIGLACIASGFIPWFLGPGYEPVIGLLYVLSPLILAVGLSDCLGSLILTPAGLRAKSAKVIVAGACINALLNLILIPRLFAVGASLASLAAEFFICGLYIRLCRTYFHPRLLLRLSAKRIAGALLMGVTVLSAGRLLTFGPFQTLMEVCLGSIVYFLSLFLLKDAFLFSQALPLLGRILRRKDTL